MKRFLTFICFALIAAGATQGLAEDATKLWLYRGSQVSLTSNGKSRQFHFKNPAADLRQAGVQPGTLLFDGFREGNQYGGHFYPYSGSSRESYGVDGIISSDERMITMRGRGTVHIFDVERSKFDAIIAEIVSIAGAIAVAAIAMFTIGYFAMLVPGPTWKEPSAGAATIQEAALETTNRSSSPNLSSDSGNAVAQVSTPDIAHEPPSQPMSLKLSRSHRVTVTGKNIFMLDARIALNAEDYSQIQKYRLSKRVVYDSKAREGHVEATKSHLEMTRDRPPMSAGFTTQIFGFGRTLYRVGRASVSATRAALSLRITVDTLIQGVHVECESMEELQEAENAILEAGRNLKAYLDTAATFDGREEIIGL